MVNYNTSPLNDTFAALSDPTRRAIIARLARGSATVTEIAEPFDMSLPAVSKHLRILELAGLLVRHKEGRTHHCQLNPEPLKAASSWLTDYEQYWQGQFESLAKFLTDTADSEDEHDR